MDYEQRLDYLNKELVRLQKDKDLWLESPGIAPFWIPLVDDCIEIRKKEIRRIRYMKKINLSDVQEAGEFRRPTAGAYICKITAVEDIKEKEYLKVFYDIDEGELKGYYTEARTAHPDWLWMGAYVKSYKPTALSLFKRFCSAVSKSNGNYVFDAGDINSEEQTLVGKRIGLVFQDEEYMSNTGEVRTRLKVFREFPIDKLADQKTPDPSKIARTAPANSSNSVFVDEGIDEELPFA